ncbi:hypothetical protein MJA45_02625 [Paenibacillus aurantius]|uniref:Uncharacterized protein n=1 Tax=Paenibacillus aurantius TaxID=2918900 RepID=A0AA96LFA2_9BACL|nr:hypothetical protein [Paenibacillus aurantius]WNQ11973.1 hypothetical protein MJA45_02625 [Paenibacillus aurantius]
MSSLNLYHFLRLMLIAAAMAALAGLQALIGRGFSLPGYVGCLVGIILAQWTRPFQPFSFKGRWITWLILIVVLEYLDRKLYRTFINDNPLADELDE